MNNRPTIERKNFPLNISTQLPFGAIGFVVIDTLVRDTSSGGLRIAINLQIDEVISLAHEMSYKFSFNGLLRGGAKSGISLPCELSPASRREVLYSFGKALSPFIRTGLYYPGMDMNCGPNDLQLIYRGAGIEISKPTDTSYFTALSVGHSLLAATSDSATPTNPITIAVEGFGSVGAYLAGMLPEDRYRFVAISTLQGCAVKSSGFGADILTSAKSEYGDGLVHHLAGASMLALDEIFRTKVDILIPAARTWSINRDNSDVIQAKFIVPAANAPYAEGVVEVLTKRGIICLPGFITNSGGVYGSSLFDSGVPVTRVENISMDYYNEVISSVIQKGQETGLSPVRIAEQIALNRLSKPIASNRTRKTGQRIFSKFFQKGLVAPSIHAQKVISKFDKNQKILIEEIKNLS